MVSSVPASSAGGDAGIREGDRIVAIDSRLVRRVDDVIREVALRDPGDSIKIGVVRQNRLLDLQVRLADADGNVPGQSTESTTRPDMEARSIESDPLALPEDQPSGAFGSLPPPAGGQ